MMELAPDLRVAASKVRVYKMINEAKTFVDVIVVSFRYFNASNSACTIM